MASTTLNESIQRPIESAQGELSGDSSAQLLADVAASLTLDSRTVPEVGNIASSDQGVVLDVLTLERSDRARMPVKVGIQWESGREGQLVISKPAFAARALHKAWMRRTALSDPVRINNEFSNAGHDSSVAVAPLLYSALSRDPLLPNGTELINRAEAMGASTVGSWRSDDGQRFGTVMFAQDGRVLRVDTDMLQLTPQDVEEAQQLLRRPESQQLFQDDERATRLHFTRIGEGDRVHVTLARHDGQASVNIEEGAEMANANPNFLPTSEQVNELPAIADADRLVPVDFDPGHRNIGNVKSRTGRPNGYPDRSFVAEGTTWQNVGPDSYKPAIYTAQVVLDHDRSKLPEGANPKDWWADPVDPHYSKNAPDFPSYEGTIQLTEDGYPLNPCAIWTAFES